jgi:hypothetical protein
VIHWRSHRLPDIALVVRDWAHRGTACVEIDVDVLVGPPAAFNAFSCAADPIRADSRSDGFPIQWLHLRISSYSLCSIE